MAEFDLNSMNDMYFDALKEIGNIGAGNAASALSSMIDSKVDMKVPRVELLDFKEIGEAMGGEETVMAGMLLGMEGDLTGSIMFLLEEKSAHILVGKFMEHMGMPTGSGVGDEFNEMEQSVLKEITNIMTGAYLNSLASFTNMTIHSTVPGLAVDMAEAILSVPAIQFGIMGDKMLLIQTAFTGDEALNGFFILVPDMPSYGKLLSALGVMPA